MITDLELPATDNSSLVTDHSPSAIGDSHYQPSTPQRSTFSFHIPPDQASAYSRTAPIEAITECRILLETMEKLHSARKILPECKRLSTLLQRRWSPETLRAHYYRFTGALPNPNNYPPGDWRILLNKSKARAVNAAASADRFRFHEFWRTLGERHHQDWSAAHRELIHIWKTGYDFDGKQYNEIPGYGSGHATRNTHHASGSSDHASRITHHAHWPAEDPATGIPTGWSYSVLMRHQSSPYDQVAARIGFAKASLQRVPVLTTRVGLDVGQFFEYDDHEFNQKLLYQRKPMRPIGFGVIDTVWRKDWGVHIQPSGSGASALKYLGTYVSRTAITDARMLRVEAESVTFRWKDRSAGNRKRELTLPGVEFVRRYLRHVLPVGLRSVRYYGFCHPAAKAKRMRVQLHSGRPVQFGALTPGPEPGPGSFPPCPRCGQPTQLLLRLSPAHSSRGPPPKPQPRLST